MPVCIPKRCNEKAPNSSTEFGHFIPYDDAVKFSGEWVRFKRDYDRFLHITRNWCVRFCNGAEIRELNKKLSNSLLLYYETFSLNDPKNPDFKQKLIDMINASSELRVVFGMKDNEDKSTHDRRGCVILLGLDQNGEIVNI